MINLIDVDFWVLTSIDLTVFGTISSRRADLKLHLVLLVHGSRSLLRTGQLWLGRCRLIHYGGLLGHCRLNLSQPGVSIWNAIVLTCVGAILNCRYDRVLPTMANSAHLAIELDIIDLFGHIVLFVIIVETHIEIKPLLHLVFPSRTTFLIIQ